MPIHSQEAYYKESYRRTLESERNLLMQLDSIANIHASLVTKIKSTRELIYKTQIAAEGMLSRSDCLEVVDGVLAEISERLEGK